MSGIPADFSVDDGDDGKPGDFPDAVPDDVGKNLLMLEADKPKLVKSGDESSDANNSSNGNSNSSSVAKPITQLLPKSTAFARPDSKEEEEMSNRNLAPLDDGDVRHEEDEKEEHGGGGAGEGKSSKKGFEFNVDTAKGIQGIR